MTGPVTVVLCGTVAAMAVGALRASRITHDCDVLTLEPDTWAAIEAAAREVARQEGLPPTWLNRDSQMFLHLLPLGWRRRCEPVGAFGPLRILAIGRLDLMAMKLMGAAERPQDLTDLRDMKPGADEVAFLHQHLDRLAAESLARDTYDAQRAILDQLALRHDRA